MPQVVRIAFSPFATDFARLGGEAREPVEWPRPGTMNGGFAPRAGFGPDVVLESFRIGAGAERCGARRRTAAIEATVHAQAAIAAPRRSA